MRRRIGHTHKNYNNTYNSIYVAETIKDGHNNIIEFDDFYYFNNEYKFIEEHIIDKLFNELETSDKNIVYYCDEKLQKIDKIICLCKYENKIPDDKYITKYSVIIKQIKYNINDIPNINIAKFIYKNLLFCFDIEDLSILKRIYAEGDFLHVFKNNEEFKDFLWINFSESNVCFGLSFSRTMQTYDYNYINHLTGISFYNIPDIFCMNTGHGICDVFERRINNINYRMVVALDLHHSDKYNLNLDVFIVDEKHKFYNLLDKERIYYNNKIYRTYTEKLDIAFFLDTACNEKIVIEDKEKITADARILKALSNNIKDILTPNNFVVNYNIYNFYKNRLTKYSDLKNNAISLINIKYLKFLEDNKTIKFNGVEVNNNFIRIKEQNFEIAFNENFINLQDTFNNLKTYLDIKNIQYDFNRLYLKILEYSNLGILRKSNAKDFEYKNFKPVEFQLNGMKIKVEKIGKRIYINNKFCRVEDFFNILDKAICYHNIEDYNAFIDDIGHIGYEFKKMISSGIIIKLHNPFYHDFKITNTNMIETIFIRLSLLWDLDNRTKIYVNVNNNKYLIKNKLKFKKYFNVPTLNISISGMKQYIEECLDLKLSNSDYYKIVKDAATEMKIIKQKGEELVNLTIKDINAEYKDEFIINSYKFKGYLINGVKGGKYFIELSKLDVYKFKNNNWDRRCVVDDSNKDRIYEDKLANRLINIYNEPNYISTIQ
jgi:hypothetical protein